MTTWHEGCPDTAFPTSIEMMTLPCKDFEVLVWDVLTLGYSAELDLSSERL